MLREYLKPDVKKIFWFFYEGNDLGDLNKELNNNILNLYLTNTNFTQNLIEQQNKIDLFLRKEMDKQIPILNDNLKLKNVRNVFKYLFYKKNKKKNISSKNYEIFKKIIQSSNKIAIKNNIDFYFIYLPSFNRFKEPKNYMEIYSKINSILEELNIKMIDINKELFLKSDNPLNFFPFQQHNHYTNDAYSKIAEIIYEQTK